MAALIRAARDLSEAGEVRTTAGADVVAKIAPEQAQKLARSLRGFYAEPSTARDAAERGGMFHLLHTESMFRVDIHVVHGSDYSGSELDRGLRVRLSADKDLQAFVVTAEDTAVAQGTWSPTPSR